MIFLTDILCISDRDRGFDDDHCLRCCLQDRFDRIFNAARIKVISVRIIICRSRNNNIRAVFIRFLCVCYSRQMKIFLSEILFDLFVLDRRLSVLHHADTFFVDIVRIYIVMLSQQHSI